MGPTTTGERNRIAVERLVEGINAGDVSVMDEVFHDDAEMEWPQSRERVRGAENRRAIYSSFPGLPSISLRRIVTGGDLVVAMATFDYGDDEYETALVFEFRDGRIVRETAYWATPFDPPDWRRPWVDSMG